MAKPSSKDLQVVLRTTGISLYDLHSKTGEWMQLNQIIAENHDLQAFLWV